MFGHATAAISLTYDDAMHCHLDAAMADLESAGLRGTFYIPATDEPSRTWHGRKAEWVAAAGRGHELGNHTILHPCRHSTWSPDLCGYTRAQISDEIQQCERALASAVGPATRSFAYPCAHTTIGPDDRQESYVDAVGRLYPAARIGGDAIAHSATVDLLQVPSLVLRDTTPFDQIRDFILSAVSQHAWAVLMFHGVGGPGDLTVSRTLHQQICGFVAQQVAAKALYCGTFVDVAMRIHASRGR